MNRRNFLKLTGSVLAALGLGIPREPETTEQGVGCYVEPLCTGEYIPMLIDAEYHSAGGIITMSADSEITWGDIVYAQSDGRISNDGRSADSPLPIGIAISEANPGDSVIVLMSSDW